MNNLVYILNGPNLNLLGKRQPEIYGNQTLEDVEKLCKDLAKENNYEIFFRQTNAEHQLIDWIQHARIEACAIIINPAGYSHTSVAILDALHAFEGQVVEVHISDIKAREEFRHKSYVSLRADKEIIGQGINGYLMALNFVMKTKSK
tara:strand:- start:108 stop:548 length:441 start_codon:yes stop_codon:yes gene_type:complete